MVLTGAYCREGYSSAGMEQYHGGAIKVLAAKYRGGRTWNGGAGMKCPAEAGYRGAGVEQFSEGSLGCWQESAVGAGYGVLV